MGKGTNGWAKFCGLNTHASGYAGFLKNNTPYKDLITYLKGTSSPDIDKVCRLMADSGYGGSDHDAYYDNLVAAIDTIENHSDL